MNIKLLLIAAISVLAVGAIFVFSGDEVQAESFLCDKPAILQGFENCINICEGLPPGSWTQCHCERNCRIEYYSYLRDYCDETVPVVSMTMCDNWF